MVRRLTLSELLLLQLRALGYSAAQIAAITGRPAEAISADLASAAEAMGGRDEREAIEEARRRRLLI